MTNNTTPMTVADLKTLLAQLPDDTELWTFNEDEFTFAPVEGVTHDKRVNSINFRFMNPAED
jgi:hypothetical protein